VLLSLYNVVQLSAMLAAVGWFAMAVEFTGRRPVTRRLLVGLCAIPVLWQVVIWTNEFHHFFYEQGMGVVDGILLPEYGPGFWLHSAVGYVLIVFGNALLVVDALNSRGIRRRQIAVLLLAVVPPLVTNIASLTDFMGIVYDLTPFGFVLTTVLFAWALFRAQFLQVVPVSRRSVVEAMDDGLIVLDGANTVVDVNPAARAVLEVDDVVGDPVEAAFADTPALLDAIGGVDEEREITVPGDPGPRHLELTITSLSFPGPTRDGRAVVLRDVTATRRHERALRRRERELDLLRQVITRVFRHNLRNALTIVRLQGGVLADRTERPGSETAENIVDEVDRLTAVSRKAKTIGTLVEREGPVDQDLVDCVDGAVQAVEDRRPAVTIATAGQDSCPVSASPALQVAVESLLEAATENASDGDTVTVRVDRRDGNGRLALTHEGDGLPPWERERYDAGTAGGTGEDGSGLSLVDWVVDRSDADMHVGAAATGETVTLSFPARAPTEGAD
jgi:PAS domain-containing protein